MIAIILICSITFYNISKSIEPIFRELCAEKTFSMATIIINEESSNVLDKIEYGDLVRLIKDVDRSGNILKTDVVQINKIASDIAVRVEQRLQGLQEEEIAIPIGVLLGNKYFSGVGPSAKIKIIQTGNVVTAFKTEFKNVGINQTIYRIYLELVCKLNVLTSYETFREEIKNQVLLVETVIMGEVPNTYYNLENVCEDIAIEMLD